MTVQRKNELRIRGASENNLRNVSLDIPHDKFTVVTGLSGSGKSSLAFGTVYAEGQRRYIETFSPYTRQFLDKVKKPAIDLIENVRPAIAIQQKTRINNSRSSVGSITNLNDYLKVIWANLASPSCPSCGIELQRWNASRITALLMQNLSTHPERTYIIAAPLRLKASAAQEITRLEMIGFDRYFDLESESIRYTSEINATQPTELKEILVVIERVKGELLSETESLQKQLLDTCDQALSLGEGALTIISSRPHATRNIARLSQNGNSHKLRQFEYQRFSSEFTCESQQLVIPRPTSGLFSPNHPYGACSECKGFGRVLTIDRNKCVPNSNLTISQNALQCWSGQSARSLVKRLIRFCEKESIPTDVAWRNLKAAQQEKIFTHRSRDYVGVLPWFTRLERKIYKMHVRVFLSRYRMQQTCPVCAGSRLRPEALAYRIAGKSLPDIWQMPLEQVAPWLNEQLVHLRAFRHIPRGLEEVLTETISRLNYLLELGLPYLTLDRTARTLSGGETQRVNLASALGSELVSTHFVLDEPSVGLHARDSNRMLKAIRRLSDKGNSVLVVEHDPECILAADQIIELGPYSGNRGGEIVYNGPSENWDQSRIESNIKPKILEVNSSTPRLEIKNASVRNLKNLNLAIPLGRLVCLSGVSGSGKSTLVHEVIKPAFEAIKAGKKSSFDLSGFKQIDSVALIDQSPLSKTPRANVATYTDIWDTIRTRLAATEDAQSRGLSKSSFSFNVNAGRCTACDGSGFIREDMQFLSDEFVLCEVCLGKRFQPTILEVQLNGRNVHEILNLSVEQAADIFESELKIADSCNMLVQLGLGHLRLGHPLSELSGGEAQRLRLIPFITATRLQPTLLIFDEPTTGLHMRDVARLVELFYSLREFGHSVLCIEHNLEVLKNSDWIIDLGPEGGEAGGELVLEGPIDLFLEKSNAKLSYTAAALQQLAIPAKKSALAKKPQINTNQLIISGAREHNLKDINVTIPLDKIVALTGVSGSGKSTIAKDIIFAEGQRRYLDCLSPYARQFINELKRPEIDSILNVRPTICVQQHTFQPSRQSTIATMSEVSNYLRLLYSKVATQYCPDHPNEAISALSVEEMAQQVIGLKSKSVRILAPVIRKKKGHHRNVIERAYNAQIDEVRIDGVLLLTRKVENTGLERNKVHSIEFVLARFNPQTIDKELVEQVLEQAISLGGGEVVVVSDSSEFILSSERTCRICKKGYFRPEPEDLSFSSRRGACPKCQGSGHLNNGKLCTACNGSRLAAHARSLRIGDKNIAEITNLPAPQLLIFLKTAQFSSRSNTLAQSICKELFARLETLITVGLDYLDLNRECSTLSGGELQRLRLAAAIGSPLSGVLYIFDELSIGLHPIDNQAVLRLVQMMADRGNSIIIIEHDPMTIRACEHVIDVGPLAGRGGGTIVANESIERFEKRSESLTAQALRDDSLEDPRGFIERLGLDKFKSSEKLHLKNGYINNLKIKKLELPLGALVSVVGLSGAGKSSLLHAAIADTINLGKAHGVKSKLGATKWSSGELVLESDRALVKALLIDQRPIGANSRSTPASFLGVFDEIRKLFANTLDAKARGWTQSYFSYNTGKGRCSSCKGQGLIKLEMNFLADAEMLCDTCHGRRYSLEAETIRYQGYSISDVLAMTFEQARSVFANHRKIHEPIRRCCELGLAYLALGQGSQTLSGGEAQRLKLAAELGNTKRSDYLYLFDEPTTGLHRHDVNKLVRALRSLVESGSSVMVIEHDSDLILSSDYILELGPGAGSSGGEVVFEGTPSELLKAQTVWGRTLRSGVKGLIKASDNDEKPQSPTRSHIRTSKSASAQITN